MDKMYYLASCDTCRKIIKSLPKNNLEMIDIRQNPLNEAALDKLKDLAGSYQALFSRKAQLYKSLGLKDKALGEADYKKYLLQHYTFLSRPVFVIGGKIFVGNSAANVENAIAALNRNLAR